MSKRSVAKLLLACVIVLFASLSTARAHQVWTESQSQAKVSKAQHQVLRALVLASRDGLTASELQGYQNRVQILRAQRPPSGLPFWAPDVPRFYDNQARSFLQVSRSLHEREGQVTAETSALARSSLHELASLIGQSHVYEVNGRPASAVLTAQSQALRTARLPKHFRSIVSATAAAEAELKAGIARQKQAINKVLADAHNSTSELVNQARNRVAQLEAQLPLMALLTARADTYQRHLDGLLTSMQSSGTTVAMALADIRLQSELSRASADYNRTVPAKMILVSTENQSLSLYENSRVIYSTPVTTGGPELPTDHGVFQIYFKASPFRFHSPWPEGSPYYYPPTDVQYWMPFYGGEGLHDASWRSNFGPGSNVAPTDLGTGRTILGTHGCVNMPLGAAALIWNWAPIGTTVVVV